MAGDPWTVLGVGREASREELRAAYRRLASVLHPDRLATAPAAERRAAEERLQEVGEAYALARAALDAREKSGGQRGGGRGAGGSEDSFRQPPPFTSGSGSGRSERGADEGLRGDGEPSSAEDEQLSTHSGAGCGLVTLLLVGVLVAVFVGSALLTGSGPRPDREPALPPWRLAPIGVGAAPVAYDAWRTSPAAAACELMVPTTAEGRPVTALVRGGWSGDWAGAGITTRSDRNDLPPAGPEDVPLVWSDGSRGVATPTGAIGWRVVLVVNGESCRHEIRADGDFDDLARVLAGLRRVRTSA